MKICRRCQDAFYSRGERYIVIKYIGYWDEYDEDKEERCEWCKEDECDDVQFE